MIVKGSCYCKKVNFELNMPVTWSGYCHCLQCQKIHGAPFVLWVEFNLDSFRLKDNENKFKIINTGKGDRGFCSNCGSPFYMKYTDNDEETKDKVYVTHSSITFGLKIEPSEHICYEFRIFDVNDNLTKR